MPIDKLKSWARALAWEWDVKAYECRYEHGSQAAAVAAGGTVLIAVCGAEALKVPLCERTPSWPVAYPALLFHARPSRVYMSSVVGLLTWIGWLGGRNLPGFIAGAVVNRRLLRDALAAIQTHESELWLWPYQVGGQHVLILETENHVRVVLAAVPASDLPRDCVLPVWPERAPADSGRDFRRI